MTCLLAYHPASFKTTVNLLNVFLCVAMVKLQSKTLTKAMEKYLRKIYYDVKGPASYGGVNALYRVVKRDGKKISRDQLSEWLSSQDTYTLHKPVKNIFRTNRVYVHGIDDQWQLDLCDVSKLEKYNKGVRFLLTCIDIFSKFGWVIPLKNKTGRTVTEGFKSVLKSGRTPLKIQTDDGGEFLNRDFQALMIKNDISFFTTKSERKASVVERFNRTIKSKMWRYFTSKSTLTYLDILPDLVDSYNNTYHSSIGMAPVDVNIKNQGKVRKTLYGDFSSVKSKFRYRVGDTVRISKTRNTFAKKYEQGWTNELFTVSKRIARDPVVYKLTDYNGEVLKGVFYEPEIQKVTKNDDVYKIEKILKQRRKGGKKEYFVKWLGYPASMNCWVQEEDMQ